MGKHKEQLIKLLTAISSDVSEINEKQDKILAALKGEEKPNPQRASPPDDDKGGDPGN